MKDGGKVEIKGAKLGGTRDSGVISSSICGVYRARCGSMLAPSICPSLRGAAQEHTGAATKCLETPQQVGYSSRKAAAKVGFHD